VDDLTEVRRVAETVNHTLYDEVLCVTDWPRDNITLQQRYIKELMPSDKM